MDEPRVRGGSSQVACAEELPEPFGQKAITGEAIFLLMKTEASSSSRRIVITLAASVVLLVALAYAYSSFSGSLGREQTSISSLDGEVQALQSSISQAASSTTVTQTSAVTTTKTVTLFTTQTGQATTTTFCTTSTSLNLNSTVVQIGPCGSGSPTRYQVSFSVTPPGAGTTNPSTSTTAGIQRQGILIQITALANAGYSFASWTATSSSITFGCQTCTTTSAEIDGSGTIVANFVAQSGPAYVTQSCSAHGLYLETVSCALPSPVVAGQTILLETAVVPPTSVTDSMGNQFTLLGQTGCPCSSTYMLQVYSATASTSGPDTFTVQGPGNYDGLLVHVITGVSGVLSVSIGTGNSSTLGVPPFEPSSGSLILGVALINDTEGVFNSTVRAGSGYNLLTVGPSIADEYGISAGNVTTTQFSLQQPERWAEVSVLFSTGSSTMTSTSQTMGNSPVPSTGIALFAAALSFSSRPARPSEGRRDP